MNSPADVARFIVQSIADETLNGRAIFVAGGRGFDTEEGVDRTRPQWMGEENNSDFVKGQAILGLVSSCPPSSRKSPATDTSQGDNWTSENK